MPRRPFRGPSLTVDGVWIDRGEILLVVRGHDPFRGRLALPGGFVEPGETVETAVRREVEEETGLRPTSVTLLGVYSRPGRDPRGPTVTVAFRLRGRRSPPRGGSDAAEARWLPLRGLPALAFDHDEIVRDARKAVRSRHRGTRRAPRR